MKTRTFRVNFRTRGGIDPNLWNEYWSNVEDDLSDLLSETRGYYLGVSGFVAHHGVALSGIAGKESID